MRVASLAHASDHFSAPSSQNDMRHEEMATRSASRVTRKGPRASGVRVTYFPVGVAKRLCYYAEVRQ